MAVLKNHILARYDPRRRMIILDYVHSGARLAGNTAMLTEIRSADIRKIPDHLATKRLGEILLIVLGAGHLLPPKKTTKRKTVRGGSAATQRR